MYFIHLYFAHNYLITFIFNVEHNNNFFSNLMIILNKIIYINK